MGPDGAVGKAGGKLEGEALVEPRQVALEEPGLLGQVGMASLLVLIGDDTAGSRRERSRRPLLSSP